MRALLFRYLAARWKHPGSTVKRFMQAGLGLETRSRWLSVFWTEHFSRTRAAQARWAQDSGGPSLTVLGAGSLLDFNVGALSPKFERFRLVDANPMVVPDWSRINKPVEPVITDITNCLGAWPEQVKAFRGTWEQTLQMMRNLAADPKPAYSAKTDGLLSLNVLSQLEIGWQEAIEPILQRRFGRRFVRQHEQEWLSALRPVTRVLIEQHFAALGACEAKNILLITDVEYVEYTGRAYLRHQFEEAPLSWSQTGWQADDGVQFEVLSALDGLVLNREAFATLLPAYDLDWQESWIWHIAPNGTETTQFGKLHRVGAFALRRQGSGV